MMIMGWRMIQRRQSITATSSEGWGLVVDDFVLTAMSGSMASLRPVSCSHCS